MWFLFVNFRSVGAREHVILVDKGGVGKSTVYDTDSMDSLQQRKEGKLKSLRSVIDS